MSAARPASDCDTLAVSVRFSDPVDTNGPRLRFASTMPCKYDANSGARCAFPETVKIVNLILRFHGV